MKITLTAHVRYRTGDCFEPDKRYFIDGYSAEDSEYSVCLGSQQFEVEVPDHFDPRPQMVKALEKERDQVRAEFAKKVTELDRRISELQAITFDAASEAA